MAQKNLRDLFGVIYTSIMFRFVLRGVSWWQLLHDAWWDAWTDVWCLIAEAMSPARVENEFYGDVHDAHVDFGGGDG